MDEIVNFSQILSRFPTIVPVSIIEPFNKIASLIFIVDLLADDTFDLVGGGGNALSFTLRLCLLFELHALENNSSFAHFKKY